MTFLGDVAWPGNRPDPVAKWPWVSRGVATVNLEGAIGQPGPRPRGLLAKPFRTFNDPSLGRLLKSWGVKVACLANNHIFDITDDHAITSRYLEEWGIVATGIGDQFEAEKPARIIIDNFEVVLLSFGWPVIGCRTAGSAPGVNPLIPDHVLREVERCRKKYPIAKIGITCHWNYELERYPMPMHRTLAFAAIDAGADLVVGHHPHCVQGIEFHCGRPIVHSLGNWLFEQPMWPDGAINLPEFCNEQIAFEWWPDGRDPMVHWYEYAPADGCMLYQGTELAEGGERIGKLTPFRNLNQSEYREWFGVNRRQSKLLPIYSDINAHLGNWFRDSWVRARQRMLIMLVNSGLKKARRGVSPVSP